MSDPRFDKLTTPVPSEVEGQQPWFFESTEGEYFNEWTWTHVLWGGVLYHFSKSLAVTLILHTFYEMIEGQIFPLESRDTSFENHVGDSLASLAGALALRSTAGR